MLHTHHVSIRMRFDSAKTPDRNYRNTWRSSMLQRSNQLQRSWTRRADLWQEWNVYVKPHTRLSLRWILYTNRLRKFLLIEMFIKPFKVKTNYQLKGTERFVECAYVRFITRMALIYTLCIYLLNHNMKQCSFWAFVLCIWLFSVNDKIIKHRKNFKSIKRVYTLYFSAESIKIYVNEW